MNKMLETESLTKMEQAAIFREINIIDFPQRQTTIRSDFNLSEKLKKLPLLKSRILQKSSKTHVVTEDVQLVVGSDSENETEVENTQNLSKLEFSPLEMEDNSFIVAFEEERKIQEKRRYEEDIEDYDDEQFAKALDTEEESEEALTMSDTEFENALNSENELAALVMEKESSESDEMDECDPAMLHKREMEKQDQEELKRVANPLLQAQRLENIDEEVDKEIRKDVIKKKPKSMAKTSVDNLESDELIFEPTPTKTKTRKFTQRSNSRYIPKNLVSKERDSFQFEGSSSRDGSQGFTGSDGLLSDDGDSFYVPEKEDKEKLDRLKQRLLARSQDSYSPSNSQNSYSQNYSPSISQSFGVKRRSLSQSFDASPSQNRNVVAKMLAQNSTPRREKSSPQLVKSSTSLVQSFSSQNKGLSELGNSKQKPLSAASALFFRTEGSQGSSSDSQKTPSKSVPQKSTPSTPSRQSFSNKNTPTGKTSTKK